LWGSIIPNGAGKEGVMAIADKTYRNVLSCSTLIRDSVKNKAGEDLGTIKDIMIDLSSGKVAYAVLSFGGILGVGGKLFAIPWRFLEVSQDEHMFVLNVPREKLERAPGFDKDNWPDMSDPSWIAGIDEFYGTESYREERFTNCEPGDIYCEQHLV
jgi:sporulation protein YlmC with PRC-barrel domain